MIINILRKRTVYARNIAIGFLQAIGVVAYTALVAGFFSVMDSASFGPPEFLGIVLMLTLLVFSVAVSGSLVFGYAAYLALHNRIKEALTVVASTLISLLVIFFIIILVLFAVS